MNVKDSLLLLEHSPLVNKAAVTVAVLALLVTAYNLLKFYIGNMVSDQDVRQRYWTVSRNTHIVLGVVLVTATWIEELKTVSLLLTGLMAALLITNKEFFLGLAARVSLGVTDQYSIGDRIQINGVVGDVINIGLLYTVVLELGGERGERQSTGHVAWIPHIWLTQHKLVNFTHMHEYVWDELDMHFPLDTDRQALLRLLTQTADLLLADEIHRAKTSANNLAEVYAVRLPPVNPVCYMRLNQHQDGHQFLVVTLRYPVRARMTRPVHSRLLMHLLETLQTNGFVMHGYRQFENVTTTAPLQETAENLE